MKKNKKNFFKMFEDIFPKKRERIKKEVKKAGVIIADFRERNSLVPANLVKLGFEVKFQELKVADFMVKDTAIERKTVSDFICSMINKRLLRQLEELQQYPLKILIIEGLEERELYSDSEEGINPNAIRGFLLSIALKYKIPLIYTKNAEDTAKFISVLYKKESKGEISLRDASKKTLSKKERMEYILEGFPGIGPKTSKKLVKEFKTLKNIFNASEEDLRKILGKKTESFRALLDS
jgi:ERCC4-type nuclease